MCGGRGTRLDVEGEKPLFEVGGVPMVDPVADALRESRVDRVLGVVSPHTPATAAHLDARGIDTLETPGEGYVEDLLAAVEAVGTPVLTVAADLPLLAPEHADRTLDAFDGAGVQVCVPAALKRALGASADTTYTREGREVAPSGINIVTDDTDTMYLSYDARLAVNVNRLSDAALAEALR